MRTSVAIGVVVVMLAGGLWLFVHAPAPVSQPGANAPAPGFAAPLATSAVAQAYVPRTAPAGSTVYTNQQYAFSLFYPNGLTVSTYDEGGGAMTIIFQDPSTAQGFQVFVLPYASAQISEARFKEDEPSGVMQNPKDVTIDGVPARSFYSTDLALGDTAEVWFIRGGYLYEVTTLKSLDTWLSQIMSTWRFM